MTEPQRTEASDDVEIPAWITRLVPVADRARNMLLAEFPWMVAVGVCGGAVMWLVGPRAGTSLPLFGTAAGLRVARRSRQSTPSRTLTRGEVTAVLVVADLICTGVGLILWACGALIDTVHPFLLAATAAGCGLLTATLGTLTSSARITGMLAGLVAGAGCAGAWLALEGRGSLWWVLLALAVLTDLTGLISLRRTGSAGKDQAGASGTAGT